MTITSEEFVEDYLEHYGVKGMKWGIRKSRVQLAREARARRRQEKREKKAEKKASRSSSSSSESSGEKRSSGSSGSTQTMSTRELQDAVNRLNLEKQYQALTTPANTQRKSIGRRYVESLPDIALQVAQQQTKQAANKIVGNAIDQKLKEAGLVGKKKKKKK